MRVPGSNPGETTLYLWSFLIEQEKINKTRRKKKIKEKDKREKGREGRKKGKGKEK